MPWLFDYLSQAPVPGLLKRISAQQDLLQRQSQPMAESDNTTADLSQGDVLLDYAPRAPLQRNWTGPPPAGFALPRSPYTNPFLTPEYGWQSSPTNPVLEDRPPEIPPGWSKSRGEHSRARIASPGNQWINQNAPFPTQARPYASPPQWTDQVPTIDPADPANYGYGSPLGQKIQPELLAQMMAWWNSRQGQ